MTDLVKLALATGAGFIVAKIVNKKDISSSGAPKESLEDRSTTSSAGG